MALIWKETIKNILKCHNTKHFLYKYYSLFVIKCVHILWIFVCLFYFFIILFIFIHFILFICFLKHDFIVIHYSKKYVGGNHEN